MNQIKLNIPETPIWWLPLVIIGGCVVGGYIIEKVILGWLKRLSKRTDWEYDDIITESLNTYTTLWISLIGIYISLFYFPISENLLAYSKKIVVVVSILSVTLFLAKLLVGIVSQYSRSKTGDLPSTSIFVNVTRVMVIIIGVLIMLQAVGISITPIITALGVGGLAVALALQDTLSNFFAGIQLLISKQIRPGDYIRLDSGEEGFVNDINWRNTSVKTNVNTLIVIPNSKLASSKVTNFYLPDNELSIPVTLGVSYDSDLDKVENICVDVAKRLIEDHPSVSSTFEPVVRYHTFEQSSINFNVVFRTNVVTDQFLLKSLFIKKLHKRLKEEGIEIPYPVRTVIMKK